MQAIRARYFQFLQQIWRSRTLVFNCSTVKWIAVRKCEREEQIHIWFTFTPCRDKFFQLLSSIYLQVWEQWIRHSMNRIPFREGGAESKSSLCSFQVLVRFVKCYLICQLLSYSLVRFLMPDVFGPMVVCLWLVPRFLRLKASNLCCLSAYFNWLESQWKLYRSAS